MPEYDRQYYHDRVQTPTPGHQPIYGQVPLTWLTNLTSQVAPRNLRNPATSNSPVLIGVASKSGAILESWWMTSIDPVTTGGGGYGGGGGTADWGLGTASDPLKIQIYTRREPDEEIYFWLDINLYALSNNSQYAGGPIGFSILPRPQQVAWRLEPGQEVYVALNKPVRDPGINFFLLGMHYS